MRKILINYPKRQMGNKIYGGESSHLPLKINTAGVIPAIFASALLLLPVTLTNFGFSNSDTFLNISSMFTQGQPLYMLLYASGITEIENLVLPSILIDKPSGTSISTG